MKLLDHNRRSGKTLLALTCALGLSPAAVLAASHSDAPLIKQDPQANITDVYAFIGTRFDDPTRNVLNVVVQTRPFSEPGDGVIYDRFADDARYSIHITDPATGSKRLRYDFRFSKIDARCASASRCRPRRTSIIASAQCPSTLRGSRRTRATLI